MKKVIWFASLMPLLVSGQIVYDFESGIPLGWVQCPADQWIADNYLSLAGGYSFHHVYDDPEAGVTRAGFRTDNLDPSLGTVRWSFMLRHGYDPSSSNNWAFYLMADDEPCTMMSGSAISGFAVGVNLAGYDDTLRLWKIRNGTVYPVLSSGINWQSIIGTQNYATVEAERSKEGTWRIRVYNYTGVLVKSSETIDNELFEALWCGISYKYSSTRDRLLWIDDISVDGIFREDREAPVIKSVVAVSENSVEISLDEEPDAGFANPLNFMINNSDNAVISVERKPGYRFDLRLSVNLKNKSVNYLAVKSLCDRHSNCIQNSVCGFNAVWAEPGDIVITEIMADPFPSAGLPVAEYLELHNCSEFAFNISGWTLRTTDKSTLFPERLLLPGHYLLVCAQSDTALLARYAEVSGLKSFPTLTDGGRIIALYDSSGNLIHGVEYSDKWYGSNLKAGGGWSLEMIDSRYPFHSFGNWTASRSPDGGTPGRENSVKGSCIDDTFEGITNLFPTDRTTLLMKLSEPAKTRAGGLKEMIRGDLHIESVSIAGLLNKEFLIKLSEPLREDLIYTFDLSGETCDFAGNVIRYSSYRFGIPSVASGQDILFNEILFNPFPGDPDYIELYNNSSKVIDLSDLYLSSVSIPSGDTSACVAVSTDQRCFMPGEYCAVTTARDPVLSRYFTSEERRVFEVEGLPSMPDEKGNIVLLTRRLAVIDALIYDEDMHYPLLAGKEGIALEKLRTGFSSGEKNNWHSASETSGWGTPGAPNSVLSDYIGSGSSVALSSTRITPDNDGIEDALIIDLTFHEAGNVVSITVFDESGGFRAKPADNLFASMNASVVWDGRSDDGSLVRRGIYIIMINVHDEKGRISAWKRACSVIR